MKRGTALWAALLLAAAFTPCASADYAVLRSGQRLHIAGYQRVGDCVILTVDGGVIEISPDDLVSVEPQQSFPANPPVPISSAPYGNLIHAAAERHGVDEKLIMHVIAAESNFNPRAVSRKKALGLMQLLPQTAARYSVANVFDPAQNIDAGTHYLRDLLEGYQGNLTLALAAYNAGPDAVERYRGVPPFAETEKYVHYITAKLFKDKSNPPKNWNVSLISPARGTQGAQTSPGYSPQLPNAPVQTPAQAPAHQ
jgi:hypothetical protein